MNPSDNETLITLADEIDLDTKLFEQALLSDQCQQQLLKEIAFARTLPIQGFPSLVLGLGDDESRSYLPIELDYKNAEVSLTAVEKIIALDNEAKAVLKKKTQ